jgi:hypothetical protein
VITIVIAVVLFGVPTIVAGQQALAFLGGHSHSHGGAYGFYGSTGIFDTGKPYFSQILYTDYVHVYCIHAYRISLKRMAKTAFYYQYGTGIESFIRSLSQILYMVLPNSASKSFLISLLRAKPRTVLKNLLYSPVGLRLLSYPRLQVFPLA